MLWLEATPRQALTCRSGLLRSKVVADQERLRFLVVLLPARVAELRTRQHHVTSLAVLILMALLLEVIELLKFIYK